MNDSKHTCVLHVALNPLTGVWSAMRTLAKAQQESGIYGGVGIGVVTYRNWPMENARDLARFAPHSYRSYTPRVFGTASFLLQRITKPPLSEWIHDLSRRRNASHVVVHFHSAWLSGVFLPLSTSALQTRVVTTFHGIAGGSDLSKRPLRRNLHRWMAQRLLHYDARLTSVESGNLAQAKRLFNLSPELFAVIPNGMPHGSGSPRPFLAGSDCFTIAHVGIVNGDKGWKIAAEAVIALARGGHRVRLLIAGAGPDANTARHMANMHPDCIEFLGHVNDPPNNLLNQVDMLVLMTNNDGLPMAIIEALSCGIPVLSTKIGGIPEAVLDGQSGYIVDRSVDAVETTLAHIYENPQTLDLLSAGAYRVFNAKFDIRKIVDRYDTIYRD